MSKATKSKATQCAEAIFDADWDVDNKTTFVSDVEDIILRFYPEEGCGYQAEKPTVSLRMIDEGRDV